MVLNRILRRRHPELDLGPVRPDLFRSFAASVGMAAAAAGAAVLLRPWAASTLWSRRAFALAAVMTVAIPVYFGLARLQGLPDALALLRRKR